MSLRGHHCREQPAGPNSVCGDQGLTRSTSLWLGLALLGSFLALIPSSRAAPVATRASESLISPRHRAGNGDTAGLSATRSTRPAAALGTARAGGLRNPQALPQLSKRPQIPQGIGIFLLQYQLSSAISQHQNHDATVISMPGQPNGEHNALAISGNGDTGNADGRFLFRLGIAFAVAYLLFLAAWFWGTRDRRSRVGDAARS